MVNVIAHRRKAEPTTIALEELPDKCPRCHRAIDALHRDGDAFLSENWLTLDVIFRCPSENCGRIFVATYTKPSYPFPSYKLDLCIPQVFQGKVFHASILEMSASFVKIYSQALKAESLQLNEICGAGFRRSLEFLIKDYLIRCMPEKENEIKSAALGVCINNYFPDSNVKSCAARAVWLGNDETHFIRKYTEHDLSDLKMLIELTVHWMVSEIVTRDYVASLSKS